MAFMKKIIETSWSVRSADNSRKTALSRALISTIAFAITTACAPVSKESNSLHLTLATETNPDIPIDVKWCDIDNPVFITLVGVAAELQLDIEYNKESRSLQYIWEVVSERLIENNIWEEVFVSLINPTQEWRWFAYILLECNWQKFPIVAQSQEVAQKRIWEIQHIFEMHINERIVWLSYNMSRETINEILESETKWCTSHQQKIIVTECDDNTFSVVFESSI